MTTGLLCEPTYDQSDMLEVDCECYDHGSHNAQGGTLQTMLPHAPTQPIHPEISTLGQRGYNHADT
jgi:hypothetical protein